MLKKLMQVMNADLNVENYNDIKVGDIIEAFKLVETKKTLA